MLSGLAGSIVGLASAEIGFVFGPETAFLGQGHGKLALFCTIRCSRAVTCDSCLDTRVGTVASRRPRELGSIGFVSPAESLFLARKGR